MPIGLQLRAAFAPVFAFAAMGVLWGAYAGLVPDTKAMLGVNDAVFGALILATPLAAVSAMLAAPRLAPMLGRWALPVSVFALAVFFTLPGALAWPVAFALAMLLVGASNGFLDVVMNARISAIETARDMPLMNLAHAAYSFGYAGSSIATGLARSAGFSPAEILGSAGVAIAILSVLAIERGPGITGFTRDRSAGRRLGRLPLWGGLVVMVAFMTENASEMWSALHIERSLGGAPAEGSMGPAVMALTMGVGRLGGQTIVARVSEAVLLRWGSCVAAAGLALLAAAPTPTVAYAGLIVAGLGSAVIAPTAFAIIGRNAKPEARPHAIARATAIGYMGYFIGPPALGLVSELFGLRLSFLGMGVLVLLLLPIYPLLRRPQN